MNHKIIELFNFKTASYDVCFEEYEKSCGFLGLQIKIAKRYYIVQRHKIYSKKQYLIYNRLWKEYEFERLNCISKSEEIVYWDNSTDPINLITQAKSLTDNSSKEYAVFSSDDLN